MEILYHDKDIAVCIKPVGMDAEHDIPTALCEQLGGEIFTLHRLDKNVGGIMIYARSKSAAAYFSRLIQEGKLVKEYVAQVHGTPPEKGDWEDLLFKDSRKNKVYVVKRQRAGVKKARLEFTRLTQEEHSLVRIRLHTGRSHQIRVQFASRQLPLVGERKYSTLEDDCEIALWSCRLCFNHPTIGEKMEFTMEPPATFPWTVC